MSSCGTAVGPGACGVKPLLAGPAVLGGLAGPVPLPQPSVFSSPVDGELPVRLGCQSNSPKLVPSQAQIQTRRGVIFPITALAA